VFRNSALASECLPPAERLPSQWPERLRFTLLGQRCQENVLAIVNQPFLQANIIFAIHHFRAFQPC
jgi:hypothetical protein